MKPDKKIVNLPSKHLNIKPLTRREVQEVCLPEDLAPRNQRINQEIIAGLEFAREHPKSVSFFGSARFSEDNPHYQKARSVAKKIVEDLEYAVVSGGGPGIMEGANRGAKEAGGHSLGMIIELPEEQRINPYVTESVEFYYFFTRKVSLAFSAEAYVYFPGGFGTMDEFFEILTLVQTGKIEKVPIILVGEDYWRPVEKLIKEQFLEKFQTVDESDLNLFTITDDEKKIVDIIRKAPLRKED
jgi:uncharacterized protein (TIGR00730 family)